MNILVHPEFAVLSQNEREIKHYFEALETRVENKPFVSIHPGISLKPETDFEQKYLFELEHFYEGGLQNIDSLTVCNNGLYDVYGLLDYSQLALLCYRNLSKDEPVVLHGCYVGDACLFQLTTQLNVFAKYRTNLLHKSSSVCTRLLQFWARNIEPLNGYSFEYGVVFMDPNATHVSKREKSLITPQTQIFGRNT